VTASEWNETTLKNVLPTLLDEGGHPHFCAYTGFYDEGYRGPVQSIYKYLYQRNKCNFRDYQNLAVSGASSNGALGNIMELARNQENDHPMLVFLELVANDVCFYQSTPPENFRQNILNILNYLDTVLPSGSHLVSLGLVNGSLITEAVKGKTHPVGVSYNDFYDYLNCMDLDLCWGYLNSNSTIIEQTTQKAMELNQVYKEIFSNYTAKNYDIIHYDFPAQEIFDEWMSQGGDPYNLISPTDGFHPSQIFNELLANNLWNALVRDRPDWLEENPNNDLIEKLFGNQGGY